MHACFTCSKLEPICCCGSKPSCGPEPRCWLRTNVLGLFSVLCSVHLTRSDSLLPACFGCIPRMLSLGRTNEGKEWSPRQERGNWIPPCGSGVGRVGCNVSFGRRGFISSNKNRWAPQRAGESAQTQRRWSVVIGLVCAVISETLEKRKWSIWISFESVFELSLASQRPLLRFPPAIWQAIWLHIMLPNVTKGRNHNQIDRQHFQVNTPYFLIASNMGRAFNASYFICWRFIFQSQ